MVDTLSPPLLDARPTFPVARVNHELAAPLISAAATFLAPQVIESSGDVLAPPLLDASATFPSGPTATITGGLVTVDDTIYPRPRAVGDELRRWESIQEQLQGRTLPAAADASGALVVFDNALWKVLPADGPTSYPLVVTVDGVRYGQVTGEALIDGTVDLTTKVTGVLPAANGGFGSNMNTDDATESQEQTDGYNEVGLGTRLRFFDGTSVETADIGWVYNGGTNEIDFTIERTGGGDIDFFFAGVQRTLDCSAAPLAIELTEQAASVPIANYLYVLEAGGTLTLTKSIAGFPTSGAFAAIAIILLQSVADCQTDGPISVWAWTDHVNLATRNGHLVHLNEKARARYADYESGIGYAFAIGAGTIATTAGVIFQLHDHVMPARDMAGGDPLYLVNDPTTNFKRITDMDAGGVSQDAAGDALVNNRYYNFVLWCVVSEDPDDCKLMLNLPVGNYNTSANAQADNNNTAIYAFGLVKPGTAALIVRYTLQYSNAGGGTWTEISTVDLRGLNPSTSPGGGSGITALTGHIVAGPGSGSQAATIQPAVVTAAMQEDIATKSIVGRDAAASGVRNDLTPAEIRSVLLAAGIGHDLGSEAGNPVRTVGASSTAENDLTQEFTLPGTTDTDWKIVFEYSGLITQNSGAGNTGRPSVYFGTTQMIESGSSIANSATVYPFWMRAIITPDGATNLQRITAHYVLGNSSVSTAGIGNWSSLNKSGLMIGTSAEDTTSNTTFKAVWQWGTSHASSSVALHYASATLYPGS